MLLQKTKNKTKENKCLWQPIKCSKMIIHTQHVINLIVKLKLFFNWKELIEKTVVLGITSCKTDKRLWKVAGWKTGSSARKQKLEDTIICAKETKIYSSMQLYLLLAEYNLILI